MSSNLDERAALSDRAVSYLRTIVPVLWGSIVATILRVISPHLPGDVGQTLADLLESELALSLVTAAGIAGWYWVWRRLERRTPDWLVRLVLGSARTPGYGLPAAIVEADDGRPVTGALPISAEVVPAQTVRIAVTPAEAALVADYRTLEARPDPADVDDPDDDVDEVTTD